MKNANVEYFIPLTIKEVLSLLEQFKEQQDVFLLAGGTDLVPKMKDKIVSPAIIIQLEKINYLKNIEEKSDEVHIGALVTLDDIANSPLILQNAEVLAKACWEIGSPQIRARGTIGGNIINASPAGDTIPALYVLNTQIEIQSLHSTRLIKISDFIMAPGQTVLEPNEIVTKIIFKKMPKDTKVFFSKLGQRQTMAISKISIAGAIRLNGNIIDDVKIAYGAVGPTVLRALNTESFLKDKPLTSETIEEAIRMAESDVLPITDIRSTADYRKKMAGVLLKKELEKCKN